MNELKNSEEMKKANLINKTLQDILTNTYEVKWDNINDIMTSSKCQNFKMPSKITDDILEQAIKLKTKQTNYIYKHKEMFNLFSSFPARSTSLSAAVISMLPIPLASTITCFVSGITAFSISFTKTLIFAKNKVPLNL